MFPPRIVPWILAFLVVAGCDSSPVAQGGSGTESGNALTVMARNLDGTALSDAKVEIWPDSQIPGDSGTAPSYSSSTNSLGTATFALPNGTWSVVVRKGRLAGWKTSRETGTISDTLEPMSRLTGIIHGGAGYRVSLVGMGKTAICDSSGWFVLDSLPSGTLPLAIAGAGKTVRTAISMDSGSGSMALLSVDSIPSILADLLAGTLVSPSSAGVATTFPHSTLGDTGAFAVAFQIRRADSLGTSRLFSWSTSDSSKLLLEWLGPDTMDLQVNGTSDTIVGLALGTSTRQVGLVWTGSKLQVYFEGGLVTALTSTVPADRSLWTDPIVGDSTIAKIDWIATEKGRVSSDWFSALSGM